MVIETGDYNYLIYEGDPNDVDLIDLADAWFTIYGEFSKIIKDTSLELMFSELKRLEAKKLRRHLHKWLVNFLSKYPEEEIIKELESEGYKINTDTQEKYYQSLQRVVSQIKKAELQVRLAEKDQNKKQDQNFDILITELEKFQGYGFNEKEMTVKKFASIYKRYKDDGIRRKTTA